jgi:hypothetical protein
MAQQGGYAPPSNGGGGGGGGGPGPYPQYQQGGAQQPQYQQQQYQQPQQQYQQPQQQYQQQQYQQQPPHQPPHQQQQQQHAYHGGTALPAAPPPMGVSGGYDQPLVAHHDPMPVEARLVPTTKYRDVAFIGIFAAHVVIVGALAAVYVSRLQASDEKLYPDETTQGLGRVFSSRYTQIGIACLFVGSLFGTIWLQLMKMFPGPLVWISLLFGPLWTMVGMAVAFYYGAIALGIILLILLLLQLLYVYIVRRRVPFARAMLRLISRLVQDHPGTVVVSLVALIPSILWCILLVAMLYARYTVFDRERRDRAAYGDDDQSPYEDGENDGITTLAMFSLYFTINVWKYVVHVTCSGAFAAWYFSIPFGSRVTSALKRAMTTSFGTICCAALILAILQTIRWIVRTARHSARRNQFALCLLDCILSCIENLMRLFNKFALSYTAIYGLSMMESSKRVWEMFKATGFSAIVNEDMIGGVVAFGALFGGIFTAGVAALMAYLLDDGTHWLPAALIGLFVGISMTFICLEPVSSGSSTLYVCFTEDPRALFVADAAHAREISDAWQLRWNRPFVPGQ